MNWRFTLCTSAMSQQLGPGFSVTRAAASDEPNTVLYRIVVWGTIVIYASIIAESELSST
jgi:hypothetical protein